MDHKAYMYVLECRDGSYYIGYTTDVRRRLAIHNSGKGAKYTRARLPVKLIYAQGFASKEEAMSAEALLKRKKRPQKEEFLSENQDRNLLSYFDPNHSYLSQLDVTYKTPDLMSHFLPPHEVSFTFCCSSIVFPR